MGQNLVPPFFDLFQGRDFWWYICWFWVHFWRPFGWAHFGALVAQIEALLVPFRARFGLFRILRVSFRLVLGEIHLLRQKFAKKPPALTLASNFLQMFACKLSSLGPGAELLPQATEFAPGPGWGPTQGRVGIGSRSACFLPACTLSRSRFGFAAFFFFKGGFHPGSLPFPPLSAVFWSPFGYFARTFGWKWGVIFSLCFLGVFFVVFGRVFD